RNHVPLPPPRAVPRARRRLHRAGVCASRLAEQHCHVWPQRSEAWQGRQPAVGLHRGLACARRRRLLGHHPVGGGRVEEDLPRRSVCQEAGATAQDQGLPHEAPRHHLEQQQARCIAD
ncbi:hypothetical protein EMIHUDRAFT_424710, partial [Emiliania huxleyi CCMP1516]|uniref:Uncharacterized protein n=4 Tax=Emiliania huxleyi TaxID=2903 RepID=A0A0D3JCB4_EMIH1